MLPILLSTSIIPETEESDRVANAIAIEVEKKAALMNDWKLLHEKIFPNRQHNIPAGLQLSIGKLSDYCMVTTDTCNSAQKLNRLLCKKIELKVLADGIKLTNKEVKVCSQWCHNHLQNI